MNIVTQKAKKRQRIIEYSLKHGKSAAARKYKEALSNIKRWSKRYDGTWQSLKDRSRMPHSHPNQHTIYEEAIITEVWQEHGQKGIDYAYCILVQEKGYTRSQGGLFHALRRLGLIEKSKKKGRRYYRQCTQCEIPGEKVQIDVKVVPRECIRGELRRNEKSLYQWTAIDECTRARYMHLYEEHTPGNSVEVQCIQTDNGTEFTYKFVSDEKQCPFEEKLKELGIEHRLIKPRTPWHNGKVERSHRMDQRYFYDWESFRGLEEASEKLKEHMEWTNNKPMRIFKGKSPMQKLSDYMWLI